MKKTLLLAGITALLATSTMAYAAPADKTTVTPNKTTVQKQKVCDKERMQRPNLDERLKLTEEQKTKAHELRMKGHEKIKPVMEKIKTKHLEIKTIADDTTLSQEKKDKKIYAIEKELLDLKQQARKIRTENMRNFEAILTPEQKAEFEKIKQEAHAMHKQRHPMPPKDGKNFGCPKGPKPVEK